MAIKRKTIIIFAAVLAGLLLLLAFLPGRSKEGNGAKTFDFYSSLSPSPGGMKALFLLMKELGYDARRIMDEPGSRDWQDLTVVFLLTPVKPLTSEALDHLETWVSEGGTLIISELAAESALWHGDFLTVDEKSMLFEPEHPAGCMPDDEKWTVCGDSAVFTLAESLESISLGAFSSTYEENLERPKCLSMKMQPAHPGTYDVFMFGECRPFLSVRSFGGGRVINIMFPDLFLNRNINKGDNLIFALNVLELAHERYGRKDKIKIGFEEFHRLIEKPDTSVWEVLGPGARLAFYQFILLFVVAAYGTSRRFSPPYRRTEDKVRTSLMQTETLSAILEKTRSYGLALKIIHRQTGKKWNEKPVRKKSPERKLLDKLEKICHKAHYSSTSSKDSSALLGRYLSILGDLNKGDKK
ncbi:MAG: DUF4350 domain-containing protein [Pseudomonadota bacterium]